MAYTPTTTLNFGGAYSPTTTLAFDNVYVPTLTASATANPTFSLSATASLQYGPRLTASVNVTLAVPTVSAVLNYAPPNWILASNSSTSLTPVATATIQYGPVLKSMVTATIGAAAGSATLLFDRVTATLNSDVTLLYPPSNLVFGDAYTPSDMLGFTGFSPFSPVASATLTYIALGGSQLTANVDASFIPIPFVSVAPTATTASLVYNSNVWRGVCGHISAHYDGRLVAQSLRSELTGSTVMHKTQSPLTIDGYSTQSHVDAESVAGIAVPRGLRALSHDGSAVNTEVDAISGVTLTTPQMLHSTYSKATSAPTHTDTPYQHLKTAIRHQAHVWSGQRGVCLRKALPWSVAMLVDALLKTEYTHGSPATAGTLIPVPTPAPIPIANGYTPTTLLRFGCAVPSNGTLLFSKPACKYALALTVPIRSSYIVANSFSLVNANGTPIYATSFSLSVDSGSWTWAWSAKLLGKQITDVLSDDPANPVDVTATINGTAFKLVVEKISRERTFGSDTLSISGRGISCYLTTPYAPITTVFSNAAITAQQAANLALEYNNVSIGWSVDWQITDWLIAGSAFSSTGMYIDHLQAIADAGGAYLQPTPTSKTMRFMPYYSIAPWDWASATPDIVLPEDVVTVESIEYVNKTPYDSVYVVGGANGGVLDLIKRTDTDGSYPAPTVVNNLATDSAMTRQRGLRVIGDTGKQITISLTLPILPETGIILPGKLIRYSIKGSTHVGVVRGVSVSCSMPKLRQTIAVETHEYI